MGVGRSGQGHALLGRHFDPDDLDGMIGPAEYLPAQIARFGIAPDRLLGRARQPLALAFGAQHQARQRQIEGAGKPHQHDGGGRDFGALDLADGRLGDAGPLGKLRQRPAAAIPLQPKPLGQPVAEIVY